MCQLLAGGSPAAVRHGDRHVVNGQKIWTSRFQQSDLMLLLARTTPCQELADKSKGLSVFLVDLNEARDAIEARPIDMLMNHSTTQLFKGVQLPLARAHALNESADLLRWKAAQLFDTGMPCGPEANMAKYLASEARGTPPTCLDTHDGFGLAADYDAARKLGETRLYKVAPINNNPVLAYVAQHVLGLPRSY